MRKNYSIVYLSLCRSIHSYSFLFLHLLQAIWARKRDPPTIFSRLKASHSSLILCIINGCKSIRNFNREEWALATGELHIKVRTGRIAAAPTATAKAITGVALSTDQVIFATFIILWRRSRRERSRYHEVKIGSKIERRGVYHHSPEPFSTVPIRKLHMHSLQTQQSGQE